MPLFLKQNQVNMKVIMISLAAMLGGPNANRSNCFKHLSPETNGVLDPFFILSFGATKLIKGRLPAITCSLTSLQLCDLLDFARYLCLKEL